MNKSIVIIGAGASGIAAATKLYENGFHNLLILEAENRIGGRVWTIPFGDNVIEMGAQWCHGEEGNAVHELANKYNLFDATPEFVEMEYRKSNGEKLDDSKKKRILNLAYSLIGNYHDEYKKFEGSVGYWITIKLRAIVSTDESFSDIEPELVEQVLGFYAKGAQSYEAVESWFDITPNTGTLYKECEGNNTLNWKDRGYKTIFDILLKKYPDASQLLPIEEKIVFNKTVAYIDWNENANKKPVTIRCVDGSVYNADHAIITISLGVLKERHLGMFIPPLPDKKRNAIEGIHFGTIVKVFLEFPEAFWEKNWSGLGILWTEKDLDEIKRTSFDWISNVLNFTVVDYQSKLLCGWLAAASARRIELLPIETVKEGMMMLLRRFLPDKVIPEPVHIKKSNWHNNPNFRGTYSSHSITTLLKNATNADLQYPLMSSDNVPVLQFAGEATHTQYFSTVHGAIESGWREATRLIDTYRM